MHRGFKFQILEIDELYYIEKNKSAESALLLLHNWSAPLFLRMKKAGFLMMWLNEGIP